MEQAIEVHDVGVTFRPFVDRAPTLRRVVGKRELRAPEPIVALDDVSFEVGRGEAFGVIGPNGAGKSTLMRLLARTMRPNTGTVSVRGRTSTLLQLGVGFNAELSGLRNIYLGSLAAGVRRATIDERLEEIIAYADIGEAIDRPMKTYSSGMFARLAFSVSMHMDPDILLLDEILAVGDASFREKSLQTMYDLLARSGTIVYVSHSLPSVAEFCDRAMWLDRGKVQLIGEAPEVVSAYVESTRSEAPTPG